MVMDKALARQVRRRAGFACEYCRLPERVHPGVFEIEHIISRQHGGQTILNNLAFSCLRCNRVKGPNLSGVDRQRSGGRLVPLFNPRRNRWAVHFRWNGPELIGRTAVGRVTIQVLQINDPLRVELRAKLIAEGVILPP